MAAVDKWGWIVPFGAARRGLFRFLNKRLWFRRHSSAPISVTYIRWLMRFMPLRMSGTAVLSVGAIRDRVVAIDGKPAVRQTALLQLSIDPSVWDGMCAARS